MNKILFKILNIIIIASAAILSYNNVFANTASMDPSFDTGLPVGFDDMVKTIKIQSNGKILIGGNFMLYNGIAANYITRLNSDGSKDSSFNIGTGFSSYVNSIAIQNDGKILVGGNFTSYNGATANRITRLNSDGSKDSSFIISNGLNSYVNSIAIQDDGKILVGGNFVTYNRVAINRIIRLNSDGSKDSSLSIGNGFNSYINSIAIQDDGKILVGGNFTSYDGVAINRITRLNSDGSKDSSFSSGSLANDNINSIAIQDDGKILVGGNFVTYNLETANRITRLNTNGTRDTSFIIGNGFNNNISSIAIQSDGKILVGGTFTSYSGATANRIIRLNSDGSKDSSFNIGSGFDNTVDILKIQSDGKILVGGQFTSYSGVTINRIIRLNSDGSKDSSFNPGGGFNATVGSMAIQDDGKILVGGQFTSYSGVTINRIIRLNSDGSKDSSFNPGGGFNNVVRGISIQNDNKILIGGNFTSYSGTTANRIIRLNSDGSKDSSFNPGIGFNDYVKTIIAQNDGKVLLGGNFTTYNLGAAGFLISLYGDSNVVIIPNSTDTNAVVNEFTSKGYIQSNGDLIGSMPISLSQTDGSIPTVLNLKNQNIKLSVPAETQFKELDNITNYNGIISVPISKSIISIADESVLSAFKVGGSSESLRLTGGLATLSIPISGEIVGDLIQIYYSEDNGVTWYPQTKTFITNYNGESYASFTTNHFTDFAITISSDSFTGSFVINNDNISTTNTDVTLSILINPIATYMRFSNDNLTRSSWETYATSKVWSLSIGSGTKTVYVQFDTNSDGAVDIETNDSIIYIQDNVAPIATIDYDPTTGTITNSDVIATITLNETGTVVGGNTHTFTGNGTFIFEFQDLAGNTGSEIASVTWIDKTAPTANISYSTETITNTDVIVTITLNETGTVVGGNTHTFTGNGTFVFEFQDLAGNTGSEIASVTRIDKEDPVITLNGSGIVLVEYGSSYIELGAMRIDNIDGSGNINIISGVVNTGIIGTYLVSYKKIDTAGNIGSITRTVNVEDTIAPTIILNGASIINIEYGNNYTELGATRTDIHDGTGNADISGSINTGILGTYILYYFYVDNSGNTGDILTRTVNVVDTASPNITNVTLTPNLVGTTAQINITESINDINGISNAFATIVGPDGFITDIALSLVSGDMNNGVWSGIYIFQDGDSDGSYFISGSAIDKANNTGYQEIGQIILDRTAPTSSITSITPLYVGVEGLVTINISAQDTTLGINEIIVKDITSNTFASLISGTELPTSSGEIGSWTFAQSVTGEQGIHMEEIITNDLVNNSRMVTGTFIYDTIVPTASLEFSSTSPTSGKVIVNLTGYSENITIINNSGSDEFVFLENGTFVFEFQDLAGNTGSEIASVTRIDKTTPTANISYSTETITNTDVIATITLNETGTIVGGNTHTFTGNGTFIFEFQDLAGNTGSEIVSVTWIDKTPSNLGGGGGGGSIATKDKCPAQRDCSDSYYDKVCGPCSFVEKVEEKVINIFHQVSNKPPASIVNSSFSKELNDAYLRAYDYDITTIQTVQKANMNGKLLRKDMAKMISNFSINVLNKDVYSGTECNFSDILSLDKETQYYIITTCRLGLMGYESDGIRVKKTFDPNAEIDRAQFGTVLSRLLRGEKNNRGNTYYENHLLALKKEGIMIKIDIPNQKEIRGRVMVMMQRIFEKKISN